MFDPRRWTTKDDERLLELNTAGERAIAIGKELHRSEQSIMQRTAILKRREPREQ
jgi:hypothetical protein